MVRERNSGFGRLEMKSLYKSEQSGRSMVEMLGVLAIIGVLSVGGIAGYSKAMAKYKTTQVLDQISMLTANIRTAFASAASYEGLTTEKAISWGLAPSDMITEADKASTLTNPFMGGVEIKAVSINNVANMGFAIFYKKLPRDTCVAMATAGWGDTGFSGLATGDQFGDAATAAAPIDFATAADLCATADETNLAFFFY